MGKPGNIDRWFYSSVALLMIILNAFAFIPSMVDPSARNVPLPLTPVVTVHALVAVAWIFLFLVQTTLVATRHTAIHRRVGILGVLLAVAFVATGYATVMEQARRGFDLSGDLGRLPLLGVDALAANMRPLFFLLTFAVLAGAALWFRHRPSVHKRLMLLAVLGGMSPTPVAHVIGSWPGLQHPWAVVIFPMSLLTFLSLGAIRDRVADGRIHPISLWGGLAVFVSNAIFNAAIVPSAAWLTFAIWLIR